MSQNVIKIGLALAFAALLPSCFGVQVSRTAGPVALAYNFAAKTPSASETPESLEPHKLVIGQVAASSGAVVVRGFHEPGDFAHRNYCGAGATQVLLSAWMSDVPDIETVARASKLNPNRGEFGADATNAINAFLAPIVVPQGQARYTAEHLTNLDDVKARIQKDITDQQAFFSYGHGVPVMVQTMTRTMPGWNHWNATHMITIFAFDFSHNDPNLDTVTYAETPSPLAGYRGPDFQTISVSALWVAMQAYLREGAPSDPMNVIS
jgi:hypothetical protein